MHYAWVTAVDLTGAHLQRSAIPGGGRRPQRLSQLAVEMHGAGVGTARIAQRCVNGSECHAGRHRVVWGRQIGLPPYEAAEDLDLHAPGIWTQGFELQNLSTGDKVSHRR